MNEPETVPCGLCDRPTTKTGTKRCDRCWELETRIEADPELAMKIIGGIETRWKVVEGVKALEITFAGDEEQGFTIVVPAA